MNKLSLSHIMFKIVLCFILVCFCISVNAGDGSSSTTGTEENSFVATKEWQKVEEGQAIPPGLHVKMDLSTGGKWAKLMDEDEKFGSALTKVAMAEESSEKEKHDDKTSTENSYVPPHKFEELKVALKKIKAEKINSKLNETVKSKYRTMEEIRGAFEEFNLREESDLDVMKRKVALLENDTATTDQKLLALQDLEYYVHQIDNANDLVTFGGFTTVIKVVNGTDLVLKEEAAHVIGSAMQSNPKVQIEALRSGVLRTLLRCLYSNESQLSLQKKCMFAISTLVRHFPLAQAHLAQYGGFHILRHHLNQYDADALHIKAVQLLHDLIDERITTENDKDDPQQKEKLKQYNKIDIDKLIRELGWCKAISRLLATDNHNKREAVMRTMKVLHRTCRNEYETDAKIVEDLKTVQEIYKWLSDIDVRNGESDSYFSSLHQLATELVSLYKTRVKDEF